LLGACAAPTGPRLDTGDALPEDLHLGVTVYPEPSGIDPEFRLPAGRRPRPLRPGHYILEPDGTLRATFGPPAANPNRLPFIARRLTRGQTLAVADAARALDLASAERVASPETYAPPLDERTVLVYIAARDRRGYYAFTLPEDPAALGEPGPHAPVAALIDLLAELAWEPL